MKEAGLTRKEFIKKSALAAAFPIVAPAFLNTIDRYETDPEIHIFSKHLQFFGYAEMAKAAAAMGFDGVDLTVRPGGHVLPEQVTTDLPEAVKAIRQEGLKSIMMTTAVEDAGDETDRRVLETAAQLDISYYRMNWLHYDESKPMADSIAEFQSAVGGLSELNKTLKLIGCYQNHAGTMAGASLWELKQMLEEADPEHMGVQYDIRHATVEGGLSWENGLRLIQSQIKTLVLKDFKWVKIDGQWQIMNTPVGEGMVDFKRYFSLLKKYKIHVPISLHLEYPIGGAEHGATRLTVHENTVFDAMKKDLNTIRKLWQSA